jgi:hypothetical protein
MRAVSKKRAALLRQRRKMIAETFGQHPRCGGCAPLAALGVTQEMTGCNGWASEVHEPLSRARGGSIVDPANMVPLGRCHAYIHAHPELAMRAGLLRSAGPRSIP